jgi:NAD(P)-dependent dehydrogenase (short-subunit alcohol dehydrogenase family)
MKTVILVTGASSGFGVLAARALAKAGQGTRCHCIAYWSRIGRCPPGFDRGSL